MLEVIQEVELWNIFLLVSFIKKTDSPSTYQKLKVQQSSNSKSEEKENRPTVNIQSCNVMMYERKQFQSRNGPFASIEAVSIPFTSKTPHHTMRHRPSNMTLLGITD